MVSLSDPSATSPSSTRKAAPDAERGPAPSWPLWLFRVIVTIEAVLAFDQAVFAGQFISGDYGALNSHAANAGFTGAVLIVEAIAAVLLWRRGRGPSWPIWAAVGLVVAATVQTALGYGRVLAVHVPLGVSIIVLDVLMLVWCWRYRPGRVAQ